MKLSEEQKNRQTVNITRLFFDNLIIALLDARHFDGDPQPCWEIRLKIGDRHRMLNLFQHAVTIIFFCFFCSARLASKITRFCSYFYQYRHDINKNMIPLAPPSQEGMGEAFLAPQGAAPAPPLQEGMWEATLAPQGAAPAPPLQGGVGKASLAPQGTAPAPPLQEGMEDASSFPSSLSPFNTLAPPS